MVFTPKCHSELCILPLIQQISKSQRLAHFGAHTLYHLPSLLHIASLHLIRRPFHHHKVVAPLAHIFLVPVPAFGFVEGPTFRRVYLNHNISRRRLSCYSRNVAAPGATGPVWWSQCRWWSDGKWFLCVGSDGLVYLPGWVRW